jgi:hypothetical protein
VEIPPYRQDSFFRSGAIGIYMSPDLKDYKCSVSPANNCSFNIYFCSFNTYIYNLGEKFEEVLRSVTDSFFDEVYFYNSLEKFEQDYQAGRFKKILSVKSLEGDIGISTNKPSWRCYQPIFDLVPQPTPLTGSCRIKAVLASRKEKNGKIFTFPLEATITGKINTPIMQCDAEYFAPAANRAFSQIASEYAQMISHIF